MTGWITRLEQPRTATRLAAALGVLLIVAAFGLVVTRAVALDFHNRQPFWVADAIPAVVSELFYDHQKRYTTLESVHRRFFARVDREVATARQINAALRRLEETANEDPGTAYLLLGPDDKGIVDLVKGGFLLFGVRTESIVTMYFTLLLLSCTLYVVAYWRSPSALLLLAAFLGMFYLVMPMFMYNGQLRSLLALRVLPILSIVACLHCLLFMASSLHTRVRAVQIVLVALQILLITFTIHLRSTTLWQVATILGFGLAVLTVPVVWRKPLPTLPWSPSIPTTPRPPLPRQGEGETPRDLRVASPPPAHRERMSAKPIFAPRSGLGGEGFTRAGVRASSLLAPLTAIGLVIGGYLGLQAYHAIALPEEYRRGDEIATRVFWHNIFTGFAYHPALQQRFEIWLDDVSIIAATGRYLVEIGQADRWQEMGGRLPVPGTSDGASSFEGIKFATYDPAVREMLVARCSTYLRECLETFLVYKPMSLVKNLAWLYGFRDLPPDLDVTDSPYFGDILKRQFLGMSEGLDRSGLRAYLWAPQVLLIVVPFFALLLVETRQHTWAALSACIGLALGSTIPTVVGYAAPHTIAESAIVAGMLVYLVVGCALALAVRRALPRESREEASPSPAHRDIEGVQSPMSS